MQRSKIIPYINSVKFFASKIEDFQYVGSNDCDSLMEVYFVSFNLTKSIINCIKGKLGKVEKIEFLELSFEMDLYADFLKVCPNLKTIRVDGMEIPKTGGIMHGIL